ncbi:MAG: glycosyltransferase [Chitinophagaceae bacterium]
MEKTLVILTPGFPENEADSTCLPAQQIFIKALKNNFPSIQLLVLSFQYPFNKTPYFWHGIRVIPFNGRNKGKFYRLRLWLRVFKALKKIRTDNNVIGLFSFWCTECALVGTYFGKYSGLKHKCWISGQDAGKGNRYVFFIRPKPGELVAMSEFLAKEFYKNHFVLPRYIIHNGIDPSQFRDPPVIRDIDIVAAGSLITLKQYEIFIDIIKELKIGMPEIKTMICGKGPEENNLRAQIKKGRLEDTISLAGEKPHGEILQIMQRSKLFLHPSSYEGFSSVCLEALYAGAHVISFWSPETGKIKHWHIVSSKKEMLNKAREILQSSDTEYAPVLASSMPDSAKAVMKLFID